MKRIFSIIFSQSEFYLVAFYFYLGVLGYLGIVSRVGVFLVAAPTYAIILALFIRQLFTKKSSTTSLGRLG